MLNRTALLAACMLALITIAVSVSAGNTVLILDASNSMNKVLQVKTRIAAAQDALYELIEGMPDGENVGVMVYGHRINRQNEVESCQDIQLLYPLSPITDALRGSIHSAITSVTAQGMTPLADSLTMAANELSDTGGIIVLLSDGEGNCGGNAQVVAAMIATMNPRVVLQVLGLGIEESERGVLEELALATGGTYWGVGEADGLLAALYEAVATDRDIVETPKPSGIPSEYACLGVTNVIYGTEEDDILYGTPEGDLIFGLGGDDILIGLDGNDVLVGGPGDDILIGGAGCDLLFGGEGNDLMFGGVGDDILCGGPGIDSLEGDDGDDVLDGGPGADTLLGGKGRDLLYSADGADILMEGQIIAGAYDKCPLCKLSCPQATNCPLHVARPLCPATPECPATAPVPACPAPVPVMQPAVACPPPASIKTLNEGESIQLHGTVGDADCNIVQHLWQASAGSFDDPTSLNPVYTAPMIPGCDNLNVEIVLTAVDSCGASASDAFSMHILNVNHAPTIELGNPIVIDEGTSIMLNASVLDCDGDPLSAQWTVKGVGTIRDASVLQAVFVAPMIDACDGMDVLVSASVLDPCGAMACDTVMIHIRNVNGPPTVDLGPSFALNEGTAIQLTPRVADPDNERLQYCWSVSAGTLNDVGAAQPIYCAPQTGYCDGENVIITLTVTDACGLSATDSITIHVNNINGAPTVDLGPDLCVLECDTLIITPLVGDPDGDALSYSWSASAGIISDQCSSVGIYTAPKTTDCSGLDVILTLTVADSCGLTATDSIVIHVQNVNQPPTVHADP